jgi:hypothetical protein
MTHAAAARSITTALEYWIIRFRDGDEARILRLDFKGVVAARSALSFLRHLC